MLSIEDPTRVQYILYYHLEYEYAILKKLKNDIIYIMRQHYQIEVWHPLLNYNIIN